MMSKVIVMPGNSLDTSDNTEVAVTPINKESVGWICPRCGSSNAPHISVCPCSSRSCPYNPNIYPNPFNPAVPYTPFIPYITCGPTTTYARVYYAKCY